MANTQTTVPLFVANQVLTAAQQNASAGTGVPVFSTTVTRDAAFGGSNKALAEGQLCYLESTNVTQQYNGSSWETVGPATAGALVRVGGGSLSGNTTTFSSVFSSTYDAYRIVVSNAAFSAGAYAYLTLGATATGYLNYNPGVTTAGVYSANFGNGPTSSFIVAYASTTDAGFSVEITNPNLAKRTFVTGGFLLDGSINVAAPVMGVLTNTTQYTAFTFTTSSGNLTGTCNIYGYALS